ncbi:hypothetical protein [Cohnella sp. REN36]|nr:hypothetical protein [Cohnella sp. REN36]
MPNGGRRVREGLAKADSVPGGGHVSSAKADLAMDEAKQMDGD